MVLFDSVLTLACVYLLVRDIKCGIKINLSTRYGAKCQYIVVARDAYLLEQQYTRIGSTGARTF